MGKKPANIHYQAAGGLVVHDGKFLLLNRPGRGEVRLPKGHLEAGEDPRETALREIREESGYISLEIIADLGVQQRSFFDPYKQVRVTRDNHFYLVKLTGPARQSGEDEFAPVWLPPAEAEAALTYEEEREFVRRAIRALANKPER